MALCCIGGVCVPYTAVVPLIVLALKWVVEKLVSAGLLPAWLLAKLGGGSSISSTTCNKTTSSCCTNATTANGDITARPVQMHVITDEDDWSPLLASHRVVVVKLTASWCKPCKVIQPAFERLAAQIDATANNNNDKPNGTKNDIAFATLDVDECDQVANALNVAMMPTFCIVQGGGGGGDGDSHAKKQSNAAKPTVIDRYAGSNEAALQEFLSKHF